MTEASRQRLLDVAEVYALHAVDEAERRDIEAELSVVDGRSREQFDALVSEIHETLALAAAVDARPAPPGLRQRVLELVASDEQEPASRTLPPNVTPLHRHRKDTSHRSRYAVLAAAAAVIVAVGGVVVVNQVNDGTPAPSQADQIVAAPDSREVVGEFPDGGTATVAYSLSNNAVVVTLDGVAPPPAGSVYQMWFVDGAPRSAGLVTDRQLTSETETVVDGLGSSTNFAFSVEPAGGSEQPTEVLTLLDLDA